MVGRKKRGKRPQELMGSHQRCWLWGRHAVLETLRQGRWTPLEISCDLSQLSAELTAELRELADSRHVAVTDRPGEEITRRCGSRDHQGLMARMPAYPYQDEQNAVSRCQPGSLSLILSGIQDPFNFGSILRSADVFEAAAVFVPVRGQAEVSAHVVRSSVGAVNFLPIAKSASWPELCTQLRSRKVTLVAASERGTVDLYGADLSGTVALIIGNEGAGVAPELLAAADLHVRIPFAGHVGSLNAAVAAGILCYEVRRQQAARQA